jgi:hypothetical protein
MLRLTPAELLPPLAAACNTISAALEQQQQQHHHQQQQAATDQQQQQGAAEQQQQGAPEQQQQQSLNMLMRLGFHLLHVWHEEVHMRSKVEEAAAAAAGSSRHGGGIDAEQARHYDPMHGWLFTDPSAHGSTLVPAVARLAMALARTPGYSGYEEGSSSSSSSSSISTSGSVIRVPAALLSLPVTRSMQCRLVDRVADTVACALIVCSRKEEDFAMWTQLHQVVSQSLVLQLLLLLELALTVQASHDQWKEREALPGCSNSSDNSIAANRQSAAAAAAGAGYGTCLA